MKKGHFQNHNFNQFLSGSKSTKRILEEQEIRDILEETPFLELKTGQRVNSSDVKIDRIAHNLMLDHDLYHIPIKEVITGTSATRENYNKLYYGYVYYSTHEKNTRGIAFYNDRIMERSGGTFKPKKAFPVAAGNISRDNPIKIDKILFNYIEGVIDSETFPITHSGVAAVKPWHRKDVIWFDGYLITW